MSKIASVDYWRWTARGDLGRLPAVFGPVERFKRSFNPAYRNLAVSNQTDLVIEGYPRCGNTFAAQAFQLLSPQARIAHRCHSFTQVSQAADRNIPCLILIRRPLDCIISAWMHADGKLSFPFLARHYIRFYRSCWSARQHFLVSDFETTTHAFGKVIQSVNSRWDTQISDPENLVNQPDFSKNIFAAVDQFYKTSRRRDDIKEEHISRPSEDRDKQKQILHLQADDEIPMLLRSKCEAWYQTYKSRSI